MKTGARVKYTEVEKSNCGKYRAVYNNRNMCKITRDWCPEEFSRYTISGYTLVKSCVGCKIACRHNHSQISKVCYCCELRFKCWTAKKPDILKI